MQNEQVELTLHGSAPGQRKHINGKAATGEFHSVSITFFIALSHIFITFSSDGVPGAPMGLTVNAVNVLKIDVVAQDGKSTMEYIVDVARLGPSNDAELSNLICHVGQV